MNCSSCGTSSPELANFCAHCGHALRLTDQPISFVEWLQRGTHTEGERRQLTILACDTVGSSLLAERMDPEEFLELMNRAFGAILAPVFDYGGYLARLEGDGFKAFFGAPEAHEDDPLRAVRAALAIQAATRQLAEELEQEGSAPDFAVRVGVHTDFVVVGPVGAGETVEYTAMGIGIVLADRLQSIAQPGMVFISEATHRLIEPYVDVVPLGPTEVKGRTQPVHVFEVTGMRTAAALGEALGVRSPLVGRVVELTMLRAAVTKLLNEPGERAEAATGRVGHIVQIVGEAGVGKSRLVSHIREEMTASHSQLMWLDGHALSQGQGAYGVLADLMHCYLGVGIDDRLVDIHTKLHQRIKHLFAPASSAEGLGEAAELVSHLADLMSLHLENGEATKVGQLDPKAQERQIYSGLRRLCERLTEDGPLVLALDNLQEANESAIRLLRDLLQLIDEWPILFVLSFRPRPGASCWELRDIARRAYGKDNVEIVLHSLPTEASDELIENLLKGPADEELSELVRELIRDRSGGNPLFIEEVVRSLVDRGVLKRSGTRWEVVGEVPADYVPETLHSVILARLDRLDVETRRTLQVASVIGRSFSFRVLQAVTRDNRDLKRHLERLQRAELIRELRLGTEQEYAFTHALNQQVAYETLLRRQRREHHRRVAQCIEELYADRLEDRFERLAHHYEGAEDWAKALDYHIKFATHAQLRFANGKATEHYDRAWEIVQSGWAGDEETQCHLHEAQGNLDILAGDYQRANFRYEAALDLTSDLPHRVRLLRKLGNACRGSGSYEQGIRYLERGLEIAAEIGAGLALASLYASLGQIHHRRGEYQQAAELGTQSLEIFERVADRSGIALATNLLGIAYWAMEDLETASAYLEKSLLIHASLGDVHGLAASYNNLGRVLANQGQVDRALRNFRQSQQLCLEIGHQHGLATALSHLSEVYWRLGETEEAWACQVNAFEIYHRIGFDGRDVQPEVLKMQVW